MDLWSSLPIDIAVWITRFSEIPRTGPRMRPYGRPNKKTAIRREWEILSLKNQLRPIIQELLAYNSIQRDRPIPQSFTSSESASYDWGGGAYVHLQTSRQNQK